MSIRHKKLLLSTAVARIRTRGALLVFPINNRELPRSLWTEFFPGTEMRWVWDESSDNRVGEMWKLMKRLSDSRQVVYSKWYQGRATFFSPDLFTAMLCAGSARLDPRQGLSEIAKTLLEVLDNNSPLSTRELKRVTDLQGRLNEGAYHRAMKELFDRLLVVAFGEVEDGSFPSLAVGTTELLFEDLWRGSSEISPSEAQATIERLMPGTSHFRRYFDKSMLTASAWRKG